MIISYHTLCEFEVKVYNLTLMLLAANFASTKLCKKPQKNLANGYSSESTPQELSNEYQHDRV